MAKKCIVYLPYRLEAHGSRARMLRPRKMIDAFKCIGYDVFVIEGVSSSRRKKIKELKKRINDGCIFEFMYSESHTEPMLLTDPNHLPTHPIMDYSFFEYIRKKNIKIGLYYCDIYWKFDSYGLNLPTWKKLGAQLCYRYDIKQYSRLLSVFYIPDAKICEYLNVDRLSSIASELPPGAEDIDVDEKNYDNGYFSTRPLTVFYVGGLGGNYKIIELVKAVFKTYNTRLIICCRKDEWDREKDDFLKYRCERIEVIHKTSEELKPYYDEADLCSLLFERGIYVDMAKPFKAYEYLANEIPLISTKGTSIGSFVEETNIGWNIEFNSDSISDILKMILNDPTLLNEKRKCCRHTKARNLWKNRAQKVAEDLS